MQKNKKCEKCKRVYKESIYIYDIYIYNIYININIYIMTS